MFLKQRLTNVCCLVVTLVPLALNRTSSAAVPAPTTQPAEDHNAPYYSLVKNEFMRDPNGQIVLATPAAQEAIRQVRLKVADEKADSRDELRRLLARLGETETSFVAAAREREKGVDTNDELVRSLREYFQGRLDALAKKNGMVRR